MQRFFGIAQATTGAIIPSCTVTVNLTGTATLATLFSDNAYTPLANPFTSEVDGAYQFFSRNGRYDVVLTKTGFTFDNDDTADVLLEDPASSISPAQITANQNDYSPTNALNAAIWLLTADADRSITGIAAGYPQQTIRLVNVGGTRILLVSESGSSSANNRIVTPGNFTVFISPNQVVSLIYDSVSLRWRPISSLDFGVPRLLNRNGGTVTASNTAGSTTFISENIPGNTLGTNGLVRLTALFRLQNTSGGAVTYDFALSYGGTNVGTTITAGSTDLANGSNFSAVVTCYIAALDSTAIQTGRFSLLVGPSSAVTANGSNVVGGNATVDSTAAQTLILTGVMDTASVGAVIQLSHYVLEVL